MLIVHLFGGLSLHHRGNPLTLPSQTSRSLFAYCAAHAGRTHTRSHLAGIVWPDLPESTARRRLSHALWEIGQTLPEQQGASYLVRSADAVGFNHQLPHRIDVIDFEHAWRQAGQDFAVQEARHHLQRAADLYTGDFLAGFYEQWVLVEQERLRERYLQVLQRLIDAEKATGTYDAALQAALALIAADPLREAAYQEAMRLYQQLGRSQEARRLYQACQIVLREELDVDPDPETTAIVARIEATVDETPRQALAFSGQDLPLVGREHERQALLRHLDEALHGRGGVALLAGEAGVGKSRLLRALAEDAAWRSMTVLWGRAQDRAGAAPYAPLTAALAEGLSPLRAQQLATLLDRLWISVVSRLLPQMATWLPDVSPLPPIQADQERIRLLEGIVRVVLALGEIAPLLLILEDVHWADEATFDALAYLAQRLPPSRVLLVASFRPDDARQRQDVWDGLQVVDRAGGRQRISLEPLSAEETTDLVQWGLGLAEPAALFAARLHAETGGNPLFVLESLRTLQAEGLLVRNTAGEWTTPYDQQTTDYAELPLSPAVDRTIARRLARLDATEQSVLASAAVLGSEVSLPLLTQVSRQTGRDLLVALGGLIRHNLLHETATAYRFSHDVVRETVYGDLPVEERRFLHLQAGQALAGTDASPASVAYHFEAGEDWGQAAHFYLCAGEQAAGLHIYRTALAHLDRAERLCRKAGAPVVGRLSLLTIREDVLAQLGERSRQRADLDELAQLAGADGSRLLMVHQRYGRLFNAVGDHSGAIDRLEAGLALARERADAQAEAATLALLGQTIYWRGDLQAALPVLRQAIQCARSADATQAEADAQARMTSILYDLSDHEGATAAAERAVTLYRALQNPVGEADVLATLGAVAMEQGRLDVADAYFAQALPVIQSSGYRYAEARCLVNWGSIDYLRGRLGSALERFRLGAQIFEQVDSERGKHYTHLNIAATVSTYVGLDEEAEALTQNALAAFDGRENTSARAQAAGILGQFAYLRGNFEQALHFYDEAIDGIDENPDPWVQAQSYQARTVVHLAREAWTSALQDAEAGLALCSRYGFEDLAPLLRALQSQALLALDRLDEALPVAQRAAAGREDADYSAHLIHYYHHRVLARCGDDKGALAAIERSYRCLEQIFETLSPPDQARSRREIPEHRAILAAWEEYRPVQQTVRLPRLDAPLGRPLSEDEEIEVVWTVETAADRAIRSKTERRQQQIVRLLSEAHAQGAIPAYHHLAAILDVSERTIKRDMSVLRDRSPDLPATRGA